MLTHAEPRGLVDLTGAADLHLHGSPEPAWNHFDVVTLCREAAARQFSAVVLKSHHYPTPALAWAVQQVVPELRIFGGIVCNYEVGGVNPFAVETALDMGARVVWLPTMASRQDIHGKLKDRAFAPRYEPGLTVVDEAGKLLPETLAIMDLVASRDAVLASGHISAAEHLAVAREFGTRGKLLVSHVHETIAGPELSTQQCLELAELGGMLEMAALTGYGKYASVSPAQFAHTIRTVGAERCVVSSDFGMLDCPHPVDGLQAFADSLVDAGLPAHQVRRLLVDNPCRLLGVDFASPLASPAERRR